MNPNTVSPEDQERIEAAAAWWLQVQKDETAVFSAEFQEWIAIPANEREFLAIERVAQLPVEFRESSAIAEMRSAARERFESGGASRGHWFAGRAAWVAAAAVMLVSVCGGIFLWSASQSPSYRADTGERRSLALDDGSRILLDSNSEVDVRFSKAARTVRLLKGRARFDVAHDKVRRFSVTAGTETVFAIGTSFAVELRGSKVVVTLIQGRVQIQDTSGRRNLPAAPVDLSAGQQFVASADAKPVITPVDFAVSQAWETGHLVFRGESLADAVEQVNRYADRCIIVDPSAASFRVIGVFNTGDPKSFISAATELYPIEAVSDANGAVILRRHP